MSLKPPLPPNASFTSAAGGPARVVNAGNLGTAYTFALENDPNVWLVGTLNNNVTITVTGLSEGALGLMLLTQDGTGGRMVTVTDGSVSTQVWTGGAAGQTMTITAAAVDGDTVFASTTGAQGIQGVPGEALGVLGVDVWNSQANPSAVTNWTPIISSLITAGYRKLLFRHDVDTDGDDPTDYPCTTALTIPEAAYGVQFVGETAWTHHPSQNSMARLVWKGAASSGTFITVDGTHGVVFEDLGILYDDDTYDGTLIEVDIGANQSGSGHVHRCSIGYADFDDTASAFCLLALTWAVGWKIQQSSFRGAEWGILGFPKDRGAGITNSDDNTIEDCRFSLCSEFAIGNPGTYWRIDSNVMEFGGFASGRSQGFIGSPNETETYVHQFCARNNRFWDFADANHVIFHQTVLNQWFADIDKNWCFNPSGVEFAKLDGTGSVSITDNVINRNFLQADDTTPIIDCGDSATAQKSRLKITGNYWTTTHSTNWTKTVVNMDGHLNVDISGNPGACKEMRHVAREHARTDGADNGLATSNLHANVTQAVVEGNDAGGIIVLDTNNTIAAGQKLGDFTFRVSERLQAADDGPKPSVLLNPIRIASRTSGTANAEVEVANTSQDSFALYVGTGGIASGSNKWAWAYRVLQTS